MSLPTTVLGDGLTVSVLGFGAMSLSSAYGEADEVESLATLNHAVDVGVTLVDTANVYGNGSNEELISKFLTARRGEVQLATKFGFVGRPGSGSQTVRGDRAYALQCIDESLARLKTDHVDLYYLHRPDPDTPIEESVGAIAELVAAGKVGHIGLSEVTADELRRAHAVHPIAAVQSEWSLFSRDVEKNVVPTAAELGVGFVPYSPVGRGALTGQLAQGATFGSGDIRSSHPRFTEENLAQNLKTAQVVFDVAKEIGATPAQVAIAWLYAKGRHYGLPVVPIPGTRRAARVEENAGAAGVVLSEDQRARLDTAADEVAGKRSITRTSDGRE